MRRNQAARDSALPRIARAKRALWKTLSAAAAGLVLCGGGQWAASSFAAGPAAGDWASAFERQVDGAPQFAAITALRLGFPQDYRRALVEATERLPREAPQMGHAAGLVYLDVMLKTANAVAARDGDQLANADPALIDRYESTLIAALQALQTTSPRNCLAYATDGALAGNEVTAPEELAIGKNTAALLDALSGGKLRGVSRPAPSAQSTEAFERATAALGMSGEALQRLSNGNQVSADRLADQCANFILAHQALATLPSESRAALLADRLSPFSQRRR